MLNTLHDAMKVGKGNDTVVPILSKLVSYTDTHFKDEENMLQSAGYADLEAHKKIHNAFREKAISLKNDVEAGRIGASIDVSHFLSDWLKNHINGTDKKYSSIFAPTA